MFTQFDSKLMYPEPDKKLEGLNWEIESMPIVIGPGTLAPEKSFDWNPCPVMGNMGSNPHEYTSTTNTHNTFIMDEDSSDRKLDTVIPTEVEYNDVVITDYVINEAQGHCVLETSHVELSRPNLSLNVTKKMPWPSDIVSTPDIVDLVTQMDKDGYELPTAVSTNIDYEIMTLSLRRVGLMFTHKILNLCCRAHCRGHCSQIQHSLRWTSL